MAGKFWLFFPLIAVLGLGGCSESFWSSRNKLDESPLSKFGEKKEMDEAKEKKEYQSARQAGNESIFSFGSSEEGGKGRRGKEQVRADKLFAGALDVVLGLPIQVASREGGLVSTDWKLDPEDPSARFRLNIRVSGKEPYGEVKVVVLKQVLRGETWVDQEADQDTAQHIAKKIRKLAEEARP